MLSILFQGGIWDRQLGRLSVDEVAHLRTPKGGGLHSVKFNLALPPKFYDPCLKAGSTVQLFNGSIPLGKATLSEPSRGDMEWSFEADGFYRKAETTVANDSLGNATSDINDAIDAANDLGLGWNFTRPADDLEFENLIYQRLESQSDQATIADLLNAYCLLTAKFWYLDNYDKPHIIDAPSTPEWAITPGVPLMPTTDDTSVKSVKIKYLTGGTTQNPTSWDYVTVEDPDADGEGRDVFISISELGVGVSIPGSAATWAQDYLNAMKLRTTYTEDLPLTRGQLTNTGSVPIEFWSASLQVLGKMGLHHGVIDKKRGSTNKTVKWICGSTVYRDSPGGGSLTIGAIDFAARRIPDVIARINDFNTQTGRPLIDIYGMPPSYRPH